MQNHIDPNFHDIFLDAVVAIRRVNRGNYSNGYTHGRRFWHTQLTNTFRLHPVIEHIIKVHNVRPVDWHQLLLEWPHVSTEDENMIAYTRDDAKGAADVQTKTTIGKYLSRHWPFVPDHIRRDWAGRHSASKYEMWDTKERIIAGVELGPQSCMKSSYGSIPFTSQDNQHMLMYFEGGRSVDSVNWDRHPYAVYAPELGWRMAVRLDTGRPDIVMGRSLVHINHKCFVRSYTRGETDSSYSHTDEKLEAWLTDQGYKKRSSWPQGTQFLRVQCDGELLMPYLDGDEKGATDTGDYIVRDNSGVPCDETSGVFPTREVYGECECCGATVYEDDEDRLWVGRDEGTLYCGECAGGTERVRGHDSWRDYREYYLPEDDAEWCGELGYYIDPNNPPDSIVCCEDGEWRERDACVEVNDEWYERDDDTVVECADGEYRLRDDCVECADDQWRPEDECWQDEYDNKWYSNDEEGVEVESGKYHPDSLREMADNA